MAGPPAASYSVVLEPKPTFAAAALDAGDKVAELLRVSGAPKVNAIVCTAGAWAGGGVGDADGLAAVDAMMGANLQSAVTASHLAAQVRHTHGLSSRLSRHETTK